MNVSSLRKDKVFSEKKRTPLAAKPEEHFSAYHLSFSELVSVFETEKHSQ